MSMKAIEDYFHSNIYKPFYMVVGDEEYSSLKSKLADSNSVQFVSLSSCCRNPDKKPDLDKFRELLRMADVYCNSNRIVVLGLGEFLALEGSETAKQILNELISFNLGSAHAVFLLRGVTTQVKELFRNDPRLIGRQVNFSVDLQSNISFVFSSLDLMMYENTGFQSALQEVEAGKTNHICVNSNIFFPNSLYPIHTIKDPYEAIIRNDPSFSLPREFGTDDYWDTLLKEVKEKGSVNDAFSSYSFTVDYDTFYHDAAGQEYHHWLFFLFLESNIASINNHYLQYVLKSSTSFDNFKKNVLYSISNISHSAKDFGSLYADRKRLMKSYPESEIALFVNENRRWPKESIYKLTDNTLVEQQEIIAEIAQHGMPNNLASIFPALDLYLKKYYFKGDCLNDLFTEYFDRYKRQKVSNTLEPDFLKQVDDLAHTRVFNRLQTRDEIVSKNGTDNTYLCWIDALGVEYLSFIEEYARSKGLSVSTKVGRAELPTLTFINKAFYDLWPDNAKRKIESLDDVKHHESGGYKYGPSNQFAIHLAKELQIIAAAIDEAASDLGLRKYDKYIIASDHGASRLAVLRKKEEKYDSDTPGEHSGRCCKAFPNWELPFATEENDYIVLADYGRFKGSRAANVEVHGGASLEEVVVPVITLSLKDTSIVIKVVDEIIKADHKTGVSFTLFVNKEISSNLVVEYSGKKYYAQKNDTNHYTVTIEEIKRACNTSIDVYLGDNLISHLHLMISGKSASMNSDFDDLF